jgi:hypothetical protein
MIDRLEPAEIGTKKRSSIKENVCSQEYKMSSGRQFHPFSGRKGCNWLRIPVWLFAICGILGISIHRFAVLPYSIYRKLPSVHSFLVLIGLALAIQLIVLCIPVRLKNEGDVETHGKSEDWRSM